MKSILEELYSGNICPNSKIYSQTSPFVKAARIQLDSMEKLTETLDDTEKELFEKFCQAQGEIQGITNYDTFTYALKVGVLLMAEIFMAE